MSSAVVNRGDDSDGSDGSDSDATTTSSTEHLTREEKLYVLRHTPRQEPQGQESKSWQHRPPSSCRSCRSGSVNRLAESSSGSGSAGPDPASSCRTLIIHGSLSDESWARIAGAGSIPDLGLAGSHHYLTSTPNSKTPPFRPADAAQPVLDDAEELLLLGSADRRRRRGHQPQPPPPPPSPGLTGGGFTTRSLPRSAKDFSALSYRHPTSQLASLASLYHQEEQEAAELEQHGCCERRKQLKMLQGLAREMNWSLPVGSTTAATDVSYPLSIDDSDIAGGTCSALSISDTLLNDQLAAKEMQHQNSSSYTRDFTYLSKPPPAYPRNKSATNTNPVVENPTANASSRNSSSSSSCRRIKIRRALSRSHPDLSKLGKELGWNKSSGSDNNTTATIWRALRQSKADSVAAEEAADSKKDNSDEKRADPQNVVDISPPVATPVVKEDKQSADSEAVWSTPELVDAILEENFALRQQVQNHQDHIARLQKFEKELSAVQAAHQSLVRSSERKESLERSARLRLEAEWRRVQEMNATLRNQVELLTSQLALRNASAAGLGADATSSSDWQNQIGRRDALIAQLVSQNKELMTNKERQDIELCAQKATLQQQRSHIEILESALSRAQQHVNRLEDEFRRQCSDSCHLAASTAALESNGNQSEPAAHREMANMEIRIRDLEAKLSEKEMLIHLLQRASMDREMTFGVTRGLPESMSLLSRHPASSQHHLSSQQENHLAATTNLGGIKTPVRSVSSTSGVSSLPGSSRGSAVSVASSSPTRGKTVMSSTNAIHPDATASQAVGNETAQTLDNQLRALDRYYQNKQSLIQALQSDKERFPNNYWPS